MENLFIYFAVFFISMLLYFVFEFLKLNHLCQSNLDKGYGLLYKEKIETLFKSKNHESIEVGSKIDSSLNDTNIMSNIPYVISNFETNGFQCIILFVWLCINMRNAFDSNYIWLTLIPLVYSFLFFLFSSLYLRKKFSNIVKNGNFFIIFLVL